MKSAYKKLFNLGFELKDDVSGTFLNRVITMDGSQKPRRIIYEPDARRARLMVEDLGLQNASGAETPAEHRSADRQIRKLRRRRWTEPDIRSFDRV